MGEPAEGSAISEAGRIKDGILIAYLADFTTRWDAFIADITVSGRYPPDDRIRRALQPPSPLKQLIESLASETNLTPPTAIGSRGGGGMAGTVLRTASLFSRRIYSGMNRANQVEQINAGQPPAPPGPLDEVIEHYRWLRELTPSASGPSPIDDALDALKQAADSNLAMKSAAGMGDPVLQHDRTSSAMAATSKLQQVSHALPPGRRRPVHELRDVEHSSRSTRAHMPGSPRSTLVSFSHSASRSWRRVFPFSNSDASRPRSTTSAGCSVPPG